MLLLLFLSFSWSSPPPCHRRCRRRSCCCRLDIPLRCVPSYHHLCKIIGHQVVCASTVHISRCYWFVYCAERHLEASYSKHGHGANTVTQSQQQILELDWKTSALFFICFLFIAAFRYYYYFLFQITHIIIIFIIIIVVFNKDSDVAGLGAHQGYKLFLLFSICNRSSRGNTLRKQLPFKNCNLLLAWLRIRSRLHFITTVKHFKAVDSCQEHIFLYFASL